MPESNKKHLKQNKVSPFTLFISGLSFMLLTMLLNNLPNSLDGPFNCICTHATIKLETYYMLLNTKLKIKIHTRQKKNCSKSTHPTAFDLSFLFHCNNSITINKLKGKLQFSCFIHPSAFNFKD